MEFAIATAVSVALNLAVTALTADYDSSAETNTAVLKSSFGFPIEKPFGRVRLRSRNVIWGIPIDQEGGEKRHTFTTFAVMGGWGRIKRVTKIWSDSELFFDYYKDTKGRNLTREDINKIIDEYGLFSSETREALDDFYNPLYGFGNVIRQAKRRNHFDGLEIHYGHEGQTPSPFLEKHEGIGNVPAYKGRFYLVFERLQVNPGGGYPVIDIEVETEDDEITLPQVLRWICYQKGLTDAQIEIDPVLEQYTQVNVTFEQNGGTAADFIKELQKVYFFIVIDTGDRLIFKDYSTPQDEEVVALTLDNLAATENNEAAIERYMHSIPDNLELPSEVQFEYVSAENNYDLGHQPAFRHDAQHYNDSNIRTKLVLTDTEGSNIAWKTLEILWTQSRRLEKLSLLPSTGNKVQQGSLFSLPIAGTTKYFQVETKEIGSNDLIEISAVSYDRINPDFVLDNPTFPNDTIPEIPTGEVIALDIPLLDDADDDFGFYVGVISEANWKYGTIFYSDNEGASYQELTDFTGKSTVGTVTQPPDSHDPSYIDYDGEIIVETSGALENINEAEFLNFKQLGLFGNELIAWQNSELIADNTYKLTKLLRGIRGTEPQINQHALNERFVLLRGTNARLLRVPGSITDLGKSFILKAVHDRQTLDEITTETSLTITGEALKPLTPANPQVLSDSSTHDLIIQWTLRTRRYGQWRDRSDITQSDSDRSIIEILAPNGVVMYSAIITGYTGTYNLTAAQQIEKFGSLQSQVSFDVCQISDVVGPGKKLQVRNMQPTKFL